MDDSDLNLVCVFSTANQALNILAESILDGSDIEYGKRPSTQVNSDTEFVVKAADYETAKELLKEVIASDTGPIIPRSFY